MLIKGYPAYAINSTISANSTTIYTCSQQEGNLKKQLSGGKLKDEDLGEDFQCDEYIE